jgi:glycine hydroxymethyltransferase
MSSLTQTDPEIYSLIENEKIRQKNTINLIASENYASRAVLEALGSILTDKYAEGYPHKRYYPGCKNVDAIETLAIERAKQLFKAEHTNVQPHAGAAANMAAYFAMLEYGDTVMGMSLAHGGHMSHGDQITFSGKSYKFVQYGVNKETERIDYAEVEKMAFEHKPKLIIAGASSYSRIIDFERFRQIADSVGAKLMVDIAHIAGLVAVGLHPSPVPYADVATSTTHKTLRGPRSALILCKKDLAQAIDSAVFPEMQGGPLVHSITAKAVCFQEALQPSFYEYQKTVIDNAATLSAEIEQLGFRIVSGGTDNHLFTVDLISQGISGRDAQNALERSGIVANRNAMPYDPRPAYIGSGVRIGTPAVTTRGFSQPEMKQIANWFSKVLSHYGDKSIEQQVKEEVAQLCSRFPIPGIDD